MKRLAAKIARVSSPATQRVAIYTRQSVDDPRTPFSSTDAQREAIESYIRSQAERGWHAIETRYDDPGCSGANADRPAFQRLLADVNAGIVDVVAVYKFDRFHRTQAGLLSLVDHLIERGVAFLSTTQQLDTNTIMGRAMLGVLAAFAQMERETIAERTRDKIHATRRKGMWTGGPVPLAYNLEKKRLVVNEEEAVQVRSLFAAFVETGSVIATIERANQMGVRPKSWTTEDGKVIAPKPFDKNKLRALLANPIYVGRVRLGTETHEGAHDAILDVATFDAAQELLSRRDPVSPVAAPEHSVLLRGLVECAVCGAPFKTAWTKRRGRAHGSYICSRADKQGAAACPGSRVPVARLEAAVVERIRFIGRDPALTEETIRAARAALDARIPELAVAIRRHEQDRARLDRKRANVLEAVAENGGASLNGKIADLDAEIARADVRVAAAHAERDRLVGTTIDEGELRRLLGDFDDLWGAMFPNERARVMALLLERITVNGPTGEVAMHFRGAE